MAGPATMSTQPQNPRLICFIAASGPSHPPQPHTYWLLCCGEADALEAEGPVKRKAWEGSGLKVLKVGHDCWGFCTAGCTTGGRVTKRTLAVSPGGEAVWPQVGVAGIGVVGYLMPSSGLHWQEFTDLPGSLN